MLSGNGQAVHISTPKMEQKCDVPAGIHDAGTKFWKWWPCAVHILYAALISMTSLSLQSPCHHQVPGYTEQAIRIKAR